jgi:hypothetical protein
MSQSNSGAIGCGVALFLWMAIACLPAIPFWCFGHGILGGLTFVFVGLPIGLLCTLILVAVLGSKDDDDDNDDDEPADPPPTGNNRVKKFFDPSMN